MKLSWLCARDTTFNLPPVLFCSLKSITVTGVEVALWPQISFISSKNFNSSRLHYTFHPNQTKIFGTRTNFTRARTIFSEGPSTGEKSFTLQNLPKSSLFLVVHVHFYPSRAKHFLWCKWGFMWIYRSIIRRRVCWLLTGIFSEVL